MASHSKSSDSMSRSRNSSHEISSLAEVMLRSSLSSAPSAPSTVAPSYHTSESTNGAKPPPKIEPSLPLCVDDGQKQPDATTKPAAVSASASTLVANSFTMDQLRKLELESKELRQALKREQERAAEMKRIADEERAVADRLKCEGATTGLTATEAELLKLKLHQDTKVARKASVPCGEPEKFKKYSSTDLLFLIDTTGSMSSYINAAKEQVKRIVDDIRLTFLNQADIRVAVVGYKDHQDTPNIQFQDFTPSAARVHGFLSKLRATGGGDVPEDVLGGMHQAVHASWKHYTRCIVHIADAPPHGRIFYDSEISDDSFAEPGSEPHKLTYVPILKQMAQMNINYCLLRINGYTDRMALTFLETYATAPANCKLSMSNRYYSRTRDVMENIRRSYPGWGGSNSSVKAGLLFEEMQLGTSYDALRHLVVRSVTRSMAHTAMRGMAPSPYRAKKTMEMNVTDPMAPIVESTTSALIDLDADEVALETSEPQWNTPRWLNEMLVVEGFTPDIVVHGADTLRLMMEDDENIKIRVSELTIHKRSKPFSQGAMRLAYFAATAASTNHFVVKSSKRDGKGLAHLAEDMRIQALCKAFALEFNALLGDAQSIDFIVTTCFTVMGSSSSVDDFMSLEPFIDGTYVKYNSNSGYVNSDDPDDPFNQAAQAFSHFTFERSQGLFLVSDLQGVRSLLTDPAIHTKDRDRFKLTDTNLGEDGFKFFFATHACNDICRKLELMSDRSMIMSGNYAFRETWPVMNNTVCCSNKLCGKIVRLADANRSDEFPHHEWCDSCWPQLHSTKVTWMCIASGPHHEFSISRFYYESQGRTAPRKCARHQ